jgi:integrase
MSQKLTDKLVKSLRPPSSGNVIHYDSAIAGFGCRVTAAGNRAFVINYRRKADGVEKRHTIGAFPVWSVAAAREEAARLKRAIDGGADPVGEQRGQREAPTVNDLCDRFEEEHLPRKRPSTARDYRLFLRSHIRPALGQRKVATLAFADVDALHRAVTKRSGPYLANRVLATLSKMCALGMKWGWRHDNPCRGVERNDEAKRKRYATRTELERLTKALADHDDADAADIFRLLLLTGARSGEVRGLTWDQLDLEAGTWTKPGATTKQRSEHVVPLSAPARQVLATREKTSKSKFVFPGKLGGGRVEIKGNWARICKAAKITGLRIHDLRHSYASQLASAGVSLHTIGALLGHTQPQTTHRYAHLFDDPLREATERVGAIIAGKPRGEILPLKGGRHG